MSAPYRFPWRGMLAGWVLGLAVVLAIALGYDLSTGWQMAVGFAISATFTEAGIHVEKRGANGRQP